MTREEFNTLQVGDKVFHMASNSIGTVTRAIPNRAMNARFKRRQYGWTIEQALRDLVLLPRESIKLEELI